MRLGTARRNGTTQAFLETEDGATYLPAADAAAVLHDRTVAVSGELGPAPAPADLLPPILRPGKIICVGLNYHDHAAEVGKVAPEVPTLFAKMATTLIGAADPIRMPAESAEVDWEAELAIVIGEPIRRASAQQARSAIFGYSVINDISARDWQRLTTEWFQGKNFDATSPFGPVIVSADEVDPAGGLSIECLVDGVSRQSGNTKNMIFSPVDLVAYISRILTLEPGDIIATGTPAGVGIGMKPKTFLTEGAEVVTRIQGIGELRNRCAVDS